MALGKEKNAEIISKFGSQNTDSGSTRVQVALLTQRLQALNEHFKTHGKDHHSRIGLLRLVGRRKRLLAYLHQKNAAEYRSLIAELGIRK